MARPEGIQSVTTASLARSFWGSAFHEKAGVSQDGFVFTYVDFFAVQPSRLCRHPSIRSLL
jgi:hypothetical protein